MKTPEMLRLEQADPKGRDIEQILSDAYEAGGSVVDGAALLNISHGCFSNWMKRLELEPTHTVRLVKRPRREEAQAAFAAA